jgi:GDPmannose 4,6-dehydratase
VREFVEAAATELGMKLTWKGTDADEKAYDSKGRAVVAVDRRYYRPAEVDTLLGDATKARQKLGWTPTVKFKELAAEMARADLREAERSRLVKQHGYTTFDPRE